jgi:hypothetical protein
VHSVPAGLATEPDGEPETAGDDHGMALVNLTAVAEADRVLLVARFSEFTPSTGTQPVPVPLTIALTPDQADELAAALRAHAGYLRSAPPPRPR